MEIDTKTVQIQKPKTPYSPYGTKFQKDLIKSQENLNEIR